jgi:hypothetical protein
MNAVATSAITLSQDDLRLIHEHLPHREAQSVKAMLAAMAEFASAEDKAAAASRIAARLEPLGVRGLSVKTLYRKAAEMAKHGWRGAVDGRTLRKLEVAGLGGNAEFVAQWHCLVAGNQRKTAPVYRRLVEQIAHGETIPGVGTWRDMWQREHLGETPPSECPYRLGGQVPRDMSYSAMLRLSPTAFGIKASRVGLMAAVTDYVPDVLRTRVGLRRCGCIQIDDMWDNAKVMFSRNRYGERVVELSAVDVLTGKIICYLAKPIIRREDDTREVIRSEWTRYIIAHICCNLGIPDRMLIMGEHGTAAVDDDFGAALREVSNGAITFGAGGMLSQPLAKGLYDGRPKGNPKYKGLIECLHSLKQNEMAGIKGQIGSRDSMGNEPETVYGMGKTELALATAVAALESSRPGIMDRLAWPWMPYEDYSAAKAAAYDAVNRRTWHEMEGWAECGHVVGEWRPQAGMPWMPMSALDSMGEAAPAMRRVIESNPALFRTRPMSPEEAWASRAGEVRTLGDWAMPLLLGANLAQVCEVSPKLEMDFKDASTMRRHTVVAMIGGLPLSRGQSYKVWINPCDAARAYVQDLQGRFLGVAKVSQAGMYGDMEALERSLGIRQQAIAAEVKALRPVARQRLRQANADAARNAVEILGYDPASTFNKFARVDSDDPADMAELAPTERKDNFWKDDDTESADFLDEITTGVKR